MKIGVTTGRSAKGLETRALEVAARLDAPFIPRVGGGVKKLLGRHSLSVLYVVGKAREWVVDEEGQKLFVHEGLFTIRSSQSHHPLARLFAGCPRVIDATCGLAQDALFLAHQGHDIMAYERSPIVFSLLEHALAKLKTRPDAVGQAAARIQLHLGQAESGPNDCVYIDPMWRRNNAERTLFEKVACVVDFDFSRFENASKIVVKGAPGALPPEGLGSLECIKSERADYWYYPLQRF